MFGAFYGVSGRWILRRWPGAGPVLARCWSGEQIIKIQYDLTGLTDRAVLLGIDKEPVRAHWSVIRLCRGVGRSSSSVDDEAESNRIKPNQTESNRIKPNQTQFARWVLTSVTSRTRTFWCERVWLQLHHQIIKSLHHQIMTSWRHQIIERRIFFTFLFVSGEKIKDLWFSSLFCSDASVSGCRFTELCACVKLTWIHTMASAKTFQNKSRGEVRVFSVFLLS